MHFIRHPIQRCRDDGKEERVRRHWPARTPTKSPIAQSAKDGIFHRVQYFVTHVFEQERWQLLFRVRLGGQEKNHSGIQRHRQPVPEYLNDDTLPNCVIHSVLSIYCRLFISMTY